MNVYLAVNKLSISNLISQFSAVLNYGDKVGIIGRNGSGKTTLLKQLVIDAVEVKVSKGLKIGFVPQQVSEYENISGSEKFNKKLSEILSKSPDILILDEPTNHLDTKNKASLMKMVNRFQGVVIAVSHDVEFLRECINSIWHIEHGELKIFDGSYDNYIYYNTKDAEAIKNKAYELKRKERELQIARQNEIKRASDSKKANSKENDKNLLTLLKESGSRSHGVANKRLTSASEKVEDDKRNTFIHKEVLPSFKFRTNINSLKPLITIKEGKCFYDDKKIVDGISFTLNAKERVAILGDNGSGKSTFMKALIGDEGVSIKGDWLLTQRFGYLDQHYKNLDDSLTVFETLRNIAPITATDKDIRKVLNDYLFRKNEEVERKVNNLSFGEKLRLSLAVISISEPPLLLFDEVTNNIDLETKTHIIDAVTDYEGALVVISHDSDFIKSLNITKSYKIEKGLFLPFDS